MVTMGRAVGQHSEKTSDTGHTGKQDDTGTLLQVLFLRRRPPLSKLDEALWSLERCAEKSRGIYGLQAQVSDTTFVPFSPASSYLLPLRVYLIGSTFTVFTVFTVPALSIFSIYRPQFEIEGVEALRNGSDG